MSGRVDQSQIIDAIYGAAVDAGRWPQVLGAGHRVAYRAGHPIADLAREALNHLEHGVLLVDAQARIFFANHAAEGLLAAASGLRIEGRVLGARRAADTAALRRLIGEAVRCGHGGSMVIARDARPALIVLAVPYKPRAFATEAFASSAEQPGAVIFVKNLEAPVGLALSAFARHFGLTRAQATLAREIAAGDGVAAAARRLGISYGTARTHLLQTFQKTGARRQAQLVRMMMDWNERPIIASGRPGRWLAAPRREPELGLTTAVPSPIGGQATAPA